MATEGGLPTPRVTPEERERVVEVLTRQFADDRLTEPQLEERLERVYRAATPAELGAVIADLQAKVETAAPLVPAGAPPPRRVDALLSGQEQRMTGVVPRLLQVRGRLGYVELDLTGGTFEPGLTTIDARAFMGYVQIRLPPGVRVESEGRAVAGYFSLRGAARTGGADAPSVVRLTGRALFGYVECYVATGGSRTLPRGAH